MFINIHRVCVRMRTESKSNWIRFEMIWMEISEAPSSPLHHRLWIVYRHLGTYSTLNVTDRLHCTLHRYRHRYALPVSIDSHAILHVLTKRRNFNSFAASHNKSISPAIHRSLYACVARTVTAEYKIIIIEFIIQAFIFWCLPHVHSISFHMFYRFAIDPWTLGKKREKKKWKWRLMRRICICAAFRRNISFCSTNFKWLILCSSYVVPEHAAKQFQIKFDISRKRRKEVINCEAIAHIHMRSSIAFTLQVH